MLIIEVSWSVQLKQFQALIIILRAYLCKLPGGIRHTKRVVAHESYSVANKVYELYQVLSESGVPGAAARYNILKERYKDNAGGRPLDEQ